MPSKIAVTGATGRVGRHVVDVLEDRGHDVVPISRSLGVDVVTGEKLAEALGGVDTVVDAASFPSPDQEAATEFFTAATRNLQQLGEPAGVQRIVVVSIIGIEHFATGYLAAKRAHEEAMLAGPIPALILRAAQFHEFVAPVVDWGRQNGVSYVPNMRTQLVAARTVAEALADLATGPGAAAAAEAPIPEIAGPRAESFVEMAKLLVARRGDPVRIEGAANPAYPDGGIDEQDALLPGAHATLGGPTFEEWLASGSQTENRPREEEVTMRYLLQNYSDHEAAARLSPQEQEAIRSEYMAVMKSPGVIDGEQLQPVETATTVRVRDGETLLTDGPFVDAKEHLGGFLLIEVADLDAALELAARLPAARMGGAVEVRPLVER